MSLISKFNFNYHFKILSDLLDKNQLENFIKELTNLSKNKKDTFSQLMMKFNSNFISNVELQNNLKNKIIWINSFQIKDTNFISNFIADYFSNQKKQIMQPTEYPILLEKFNDYFGANEFSISYQEEIHNFFQAIINILIDEETIFIKNNSAFFETSQKRYFTYPFTCKGYIVYIRNPLSIYSELRNNFKDRDLAMNYFFNLENNYDSCLVNNSKIEINKQGWPINTNSWLDENVKNTYKGLVIKESDLINDPTETLLSIVAHLNSVGLKINLDYNFIENYLKVNPVPFDYSQELDLSNKELKFLKNNINPIIQDPDFQI